MFDFDFDFENKNLWILAYFAYLGISLWTSSILKVTREINKRSGFGEVVVFENMPPNIPHKEKFFYVFSLNILIFGIVGNLFSIGLVFFYTTEFTQPISAFFREIFGGFIGLPKLFTNA